MIGCRLLTKHSTGTPRQGQSHSRTRVSTSSSSAGSPKRGCTFVNLVSSEEEEDVVDSRRKRSRYSRADSSPPESLRKQHLQENASAGSSRSFPIPEPPPEAKSGSLGPQHRQDKESHALTGPFNGSISRRPVQTFQHVEIPVKELKAVTLTESSAIAERGRFLRNLAQLRGRSVTVVNQVDQSSPSTKFRFVNESILGRGVSKAPEEVMIGCTCLQDRRKIGCEYLYCECLDDSAETKDGKKLFPYSAAKKNTGCLRDFYLESRHHIYECNANCNCEDNCKNRNVQHGRGVPLEIFKTLNRGWGK